MLDINFIRTNQQTVEEATRSKGFDPSLIGQALALDDSRRQLLGVVDALRAERNQNAEAMKGSASTGGKPDQSLIDRGKQIKIELASHEPELEQTEDDLRRTLKQIPNIIAADVPLGDESASTELRTWGEPKPSGVDHLDYCMSRDWVDFERGANVAGAKFYYVKHELALLENAVQQYVLAKILSRGFHFMTVPHMVSSAVLEGTGFNPRTSTQSDEYFIEGEDLALIATAEIPLTGYHMGVIINESDLPLLYAGYSPCYRKEAGAAGKHTRGLFRVHQFNKLEMYAFATRDQSEQLHEQILAIEEEIWQELGIPYRIINIAAGDLGAPAYKKYDIEYWSPADQSYRELTSCSNCTDYQARNLNIRVRRTDGTVETLHTLNGTATALARTLVAIIENYATLEGKLKVPAPLQKYLNNKEEI